MDTDWQRGVFVMFQMSWRNFEPKILGTSDEKLLLESKQLKHLFFSLESNQIEKNTVKSSCCIKVSTELSLLLNLKHKDQMNLYSLILQSENFPTSSF